MNKVVVAVCLSSLLFGCSDSDQKVNAFLSSSVKQMTLSFHRLVDNFTLNRPKMSNTVVRLDNISSTSNSTIVPINTNIKQNTSLVNSNETSIQWQWPAKGNIIEAFTEANKGIDIAGTLGDDVVAAAYGQVVYAGNVLPGYGNMIIIKHNNSYLTAYARNQSILVKEREEVEAGQQIATMGKSGSNVASLHFEIRYNAKSVDPLKYLP